MPRARLPKRSPTEILAEYCRAHGHPEPVAEYEFAQPVREWAFDFAWPALLVALELEGGTFSGGRHTTGAGFRNDCVKYNEAAIRGWLVLRVMTSEMARPGFLGVLGRALTVRTNG